MNVNNLLLSLIIKHNERYYFNMRKLEAGYMKWKPAWVMPLRRRPNLDTITEEIESIAIGDGPRQPAIDRTELRYHNVAVPNRSDSDAGGDISIRDIFQPVYMVCLNEFKELMTSCKPQAVIALLLILAFSLIAMCVLYFDKKKL